MPAHAPLEFFDLGERRARDHDEGHVALRKMDHPAVEMIGQERTARAAFFPVGAEHEVIDDQLALAAEQIGQRRSAHRIRSSCPRAPRAIRGACGSAHRARG